MHQNSLPRDLFFLKKYYAITLLHLKREQIGFSCRKDNSYTIFSIFILPLLNEINVSVEKQIPLVPTRTLCIKAVVNMEDKHPLNLDKFHLFVKLFFSCP